MALESRAGGKTDKFQESLTAVLQINPLLWGQISEPRPWDDLARKARRIAEHAMVQEAGDALAQCTAIIQNGCKKKE